MRIYSKKATEDGDFLLHDEILAFARTHFEKKQWFQRAEHVVALYFRVRIGARGDAVRDSRPRQLGPPKSSISVSTHLRAFHFSFSVLVACEALFHPKRVVFLMFADYTVVAPPHSSLAPFTRVTAVLECVSRSLHPK